MNQLYLTVVLTEREEEALKRAIDGELGDPICLWKGGNEALIIAVQKFLVMVGIPTSLEGDCIVDGKWGPGLSRALFFQKRLFAVSNEAIPEDEALYATSISALRSSLCNETLRVFSLRQLMDWSHLAITNSDNPRRKLWNWNGTINRVQLRCNELFTNDRISAKAAQDMISSYPEGQGLPQHFYHLLLAIAKEECGGVPSPRLEQANFVLYRPVFEGFNLGRTYGLGQISGHDFGALGVSGPVYRNTADPVLQYLWTGRKLLQSEAAAVAKKSRLTFDDCTKIARYYHGAGFVASRYNHGLMLSLQEFRLLEVRSQQ